MFLLKKIIKIAFSSSDDNRIQSTDSTETSAYGMNKDLVCKKEGIKRNNTINQYKIIKS